LHDNFTLFFLNILFLDSYDEAAVKERQIFISASSSESEDHVAKKNNNKRNKHVPLINDDSSDSKFS